MLLTADELKRFPDLRLRLSVNGEVRQDARVGTDMIYSPLAGPAGADPLPAPRPGRPRCSPAPRSAPPSSAPPKPVAMIASLLPPPIRWKLFFRRQATNPKYLRDGDVIEASVATDDGAIDLGTQRTIVRWAR